MPGPVQFSYATTADIARLVELVQSAYRGPASRAGWTTEADLLEGQRIDATMLTELLATPGAHVLLASRSDGELVACCELREPGRSGGGAKCDPAEAPAGHAYLGMFAVGPQHQAGGVGRAVLAHAEHLAAADWAATTMRMTVIDGRPELIAWYERRGYTQTGEHQPFPYGDERFGIPTRDDLRMTVLEKPLRPTD